MTSLLYSHPRSSVTTVIQFYNEEHLHDQLDLLINIGNILIEDHDYILDIYQAGHKQVVIDGKIVFEVVELPDDLKIRLILL